ncbi:hypothetical protein [Nostoc sp. CHAB 5715]|uniref:hypothetical protein n=1 Tax=Nostoc sp. CHAB 5715 TaxID=2780400 RepID=UPI001E54D186|nr:hypothetical protein [Nostoc sp. CHAB 5715]MCC5623254.1 hypothetical protein [Nostoc sp. CHAB 5715]
MNNEEILNIPQPDNKVVLSKDVFVLNTLAMGIAIQILAKITEETIEDWRSYVGAKATEQYRELSAEKIKEIADSLEIL